MSWHVGWRGQMNGCSIDESVDCRDYLSLYGYVKGTHSVLLFLRMIHAQVSPLVMSDMSMCSSLVWETYRCIFWILGTYIYWPGYSYGGSSSKAFQSSRPFLIVMSLTVPPPLSSLLFLFHPGLRNKENVLTKWAGQNLRRINWGEKMSSDSDHPFLPVSVCYGSSKKISELPLMSQSIVKNNLWWWFDNLTWYPLPSVFLFTWEIFFFCTLRLIFFDVGRLAWHTDWYQARSFLVMSANYSKRE